MEQSEEGTRGYREGRMEGGGSRRKMVGGTRKDRRGSKEKGGRGERRREEERRNRDKETRVQKYNEECKQAIPQGRGRRQLESLHTRKKRVLSFVHELEVVLACKCCNAGTHHATRGWHAHLLAVSFHFWFTNVPFSL